MRCFARFGFICTNQPFNGQCSHHIETSQLICSANQLTGFYTMGTLAVKGLINVKNTNGGMLLLVKLLKVTLLHRCFYRFLNCTNDIKSHKASPIVHVLIQYFEPFCGQARVQVKLEFRGLMECKFAVPLSECV